MSVKKGELRIEYDVDTIRNSISYEIVSVKPEESLTESDPE